jgi:hypothetical protein
MNLTKDIIKRLSHFFDSYKKKVEFLKDLSKKRQGADEIILLVCCYLEQLGRCLFPKDESSKRVFELMLLNHSGENDVLSLISLGNLICDVLDMAEASSYIIPKAGRVRLRSDEEKPLIKFVDQTGIALTEKSVRKLLLALYKSIKSDFRIHPYQTKQKNCYGEKGSVIDSIMSYAELRRVGAEINEENIKNLIDGYTYTSILYRDYRCKAVHEAAGIYVEHEKFWRMKRPYFFEVYSVFHKYPVFILGFPSFFLIECLETCIECAEKAIKGKGLLPPDIWGAICDWGEFEFMDVEGIEEPRPIRLKIE